MKKVIITLLSIIFIISTITSVYAATGSINFGASSDTIIKGKTFTVTVAGTADSNITGMQAGLSYDTNKLSIESKSAGQGYFDASSGNEIAIGSTSAESLSKAGTLYTITFKVLETASEGETKISLTNAVLATAGGQIDPSNKEVTVTIKVDDTTAGGNQGGNQQQGDEQNKKDDSNPSNGVNGSNSDGNNGNSDTDKKEENKNVNTNKNTNKNTSKNTNKNTTKKLPQTGVESTTLFAIIALAVVGITSFISYRKYKNI